MWESCDTVNVYIILNFCLGKRQIKFYKQYKRKLFFSWIYRLTIIQDAAFSQRLTLLVIVFLIWIVKLNIENTPFSVLLYIYIAYKYIKKLYLVFCRYHKIKWHCFYDTRTSCNYTIWDTLLLTQYSNFDLLVRCS